MRRTILAIVLAVAVMWAAVPFAEAGTLDKDVILVGTESTYPPYEFRDDKNQLQGFDIELVETIAQELGKKVEWVDMPFDSLIPALISGKIDLIAAGLSATPERAKRVSFTIPYEISLSSFIVKADRDDIKTLDDLKGKVVAVQLGTVQDTYTTGLGTVEVKRFQKFDDCVREVSLGRADASLMDRPVANNFVESGEFKGKVKIAFDQEITGAGKALAVRKDDVEFLKALDAVLQKMKDDGRLDALLKKWMKW